MEIKIKKLPATAIRIISCLRLRNAGCDRDWNLATNCNRLVVVPKHEKLGYRILHERSYLWGDIESFPLPPEGYAVCPFTKAPCLFIVSSKPQRAC